MSDVDAHGPIDYLIMEFEGDGERPETVAAVLDLIDRGLGDPRSDTWWHPLPPDDDNVRRVQRPW